MTLHLPRRFPWRLFHDTPKVVHFVMLSVARPVAKWCMWWVFKLSKPKKICENWSRKLVSWEAIAYVYRSISVVSLSVRRRSAWRCRSNHQLPVHRCCSTPHSNSRWTRPSYYNVAPSGSKFYWTKLVMAALWNTAGHYIFVLRFLLSSIYLLSSFFIPYSQLSQIGWLPYFHAWPKCEFNMQVWNVLHEARWKYRPPKNRQKSPSGHHRTICRAMSCLRN